MARSIENKPQAIIVAGPNGSGKTTFALKYLADHPVRYLSADTIAEQLDGNLDDVRIQAGRQFIRELDEQIECGESFVLESTLSGLTLRNATSRLKAAGYEVSILFIFLESADACVARIHERIRRGGHPVADVDVRRRFARSMRNFWNVYRDLADYWHVFYNGEGQANEVAVGEGTEIQIHSEPLFGLLERIVAGEVG